MRNLLRFAVLGLACALVVGCGGKKITVGKLDAVTITAGETKEVPVTITREKSDTDVTVKASDLPAGVTASDATIKKGETKGMLKLNAAADAAAGEKDAKVTASGDGVSDNKTVKVTVKAKAAGGDGTPKAGGKLTVTAPADVTLNAGDKSVPVKISITRDKMDKDAKVTVDNLPEGVTVATKDTTIAAGKTDITLELAADEKAKADEKKATVTVSGDGADAAKAEIKVTVKAKAAPEAAKAKLSLAAPADVAMKAGDKDKTKVTVKLAEKAAKDVKVTVDTPKDVTAEPKEATIKAGAMETTFELAAGAAAPAESTVTIRATSEGAEPDTKTFKLNVKK